METGRSQYHKPDVGLFVCIIVLSIFGLLMVFSASMTDDMGSTYFLVRQAQNMLIGFACMCVTFLIDYRRWRAIAPLLFLLAAALLVGVELFGVTVEGAQRWLVSSRFQPSEFAKLAVVLFMAAWLPRKGDDVRTLSYGLLPFALLIGLIVGLVRRQPDLGTAMVILGTAAALFIVSGAAIVQTLLAGGLTGIVFYFTAYSYQHDRIGQFWNPCSETNPKLLQVCQGIIAMGSGGLSGLGVGSSRFRWNLHAPFSDSILGIIGEELGIIGTLFVVALFALLIYRGFRAALRTPDSFGRLTAAGITLWIGIQACINLGGNVALLPFTGVPLPFISYGGSSLVSTLAACGILLNITRQTQDAATFRDKQRSANAPVDYGRGDGWSRLPGSVGR